MNMPRRLILAATILALAGGCHASLAQQRLTATGDDHPTSANLIDTCADGAINGLITVSIAATVALFAEVALPAYPILFTVGPAVGCRFIGKHLKEVLLP